jgi:hypothetical protein
MTSVMENAIRVFGVFSVVALTGAIACTVTSSNPPNDGGPAQDAASQQDAGFSNETCIAEKTNEACIGCCVGIHPSGAQVFNKALVGCLCNGEGIAPDSDAGDGGDAGDAGAGDAGTGGPCAAVCNSPSCAEEVLDSNPSEACLKCLSDNTAENAACNAPIGKECSTSDDCYSLLAECVQKCPE